MQEETCKGHWEGDRGAGFVARWPRQCADTLGKHKNSVLCYKWIIRDVETRQTINYLQHRSNLWVSGSIWNKNINSTKFILSFLNKAFSMSSLWHMTYNARNWISRIIQFFNSSGNIFYPESFSFLTAVATFSSFRLLTTTLAPSAARRSAIAKPILLQIKYLWVQSSNRYIHQILIPQHAFACLWEVLDATKIKH